ncbi:hypothetical protein EVAR_16884_1 [Eumeta japonica]|uniref:Uncharacterized protein n=1 Tax=Eumeta variegata TaxID=151549 RepID=A0A4C1V2H1_EUMVA|nr:hypothetical protein EVAR_16884_1 [Eumeta japonica]
MAQNHPRAKSSEGVQIKRTCPDDTLTDARLRVNLYNRGRREKSVSGRRQLSTHALYSVKRASARPREARELATRIANDYRVIPEYSKVIMEYKNLRRYSLRNSDLLKRRWNRYRDEWKGRDKRPIFLPDRRDEHFYNHNPVYRPEESMHKKMDFRMKLKPGPGVDSVGHIPIPDELMIKRNFRTVPSNKLKGSENRKPIQNREASETNAANISPCKTSKVTKIKIQMAEPEFQRGREVESSTGPASESNAGARPELESKRV